jgi:hypothetical protein
LGKADLIILREHSDLGINNLNQSVNKDYSKRANEFISHYICSEKGNGQKNQSLPGKTEIQMKNYLMTFL